jgi:hypothetical protein
MICQFPYGNTTYIDATDWVRETAIKMKADPRISECGNYKIADTPITMCRNRAVEYALKNNFDYVVMIDSDMHPDHQLGIEPNAKPFWETAWEFALNSTEPVIVGAPYCGPPPNENVYVFRWRNSQSENPNEEFRIEQFSRYEANSLSGISEVAALPTGLMLIDMRAIKLLKAAKPNSTLEILEEFKAGRLTAGIAERLIGWQQGMFYYEWTDNNATHKASTEDVTFSRDLSLLGVKSYCTWDSWAAHIKQKYVLRPGFIGPEQVSKQMTLAIDREIAKIGKS